MTHHTLGAAVTAAAAEMRKRSTHTSEVRVESLPQEVQDYIKQLAATVAAINLRITALEKSVSDLSVLVDGVGNVSLNDLIRRSA